MESKGEPSDGAGQLLKVPFRPRWQPGNLAAKPPDWQPPTIRDRPLLGLKGRLEDLKHSLHPLLAALTHEDITQTGRRRKVEALAGYLPDRPLHHRRRPALSERGITMDELEEAAVAVVAGAPWRELFLEEAPAPEGHPVHPEVGVWFRLDRLRRQLGPAVAERVLGAGVRRQEEGLEQLSAPRDLDREDGAEDVERRVEARLELGRHHHQVERRAERLTEAQRVVYHLVERDGFTPSEAAAELDISPEAARKRLQRARAAVGLTED